MNILSFKEIQKKIFPSQKVVLLTVNQNRNITLHAVVDSMRTNGFFVVSIKKINRVPYFLKKQFLLICKIEECIYGCYLICTNILLHEFHLKIFLSECVLSQKEAISKTYQYFSSEKQGVILCSFSSFKENGFQSSYYFDWVVLEDVYKYGFCIHSNQETSVGNHLYILYQLSDVYLEENRCVVVWSIPNFLNQSSLKYTYGLRFINKKSRALMDIQQFFLKSLFYQNSSFDGLSDLKERDL